MIIIAIVPIILILIVTTTITTTALREAAMGVVQDAIHLSVGIVGYLRFNHYTATQNTCSLSKVETVGIVCWCECMAYGAPWNVAANMLKVKKAGYLLKGGRGQWLERNILDLPRIAQRVLYELGRLTERQL